MRRDGRRTARMLAATALVALVCLITAACGDDESSTSPTATATVRAVVCSLTSATVGRYDTSQISASAQMSDGSTQDVTAKATWASSNPEIASVQAGLLVGIRLGTAKITAGYGGYLSTMDVAVRRRMALHGSLGIHDQTSVGTISRVTVYLDGVSVAACTPTSASTGCWAYLGSETAYPAVEPGQHELSVKVDTVGSPASLTVQAEGSTSLLDRDTTDSLATFRLGTRLVTIVPGGTFTWTIDVHEYF
jgi:hypothetical protein